MTRSTGVGRGHSPRRPWTDVDLGILADTRDLPGSEVAAILGRTRSSVEAMRARVRRGFTGRADHIWTEEEVEFLINHPHWKARQLAVHMGVQKHVVTKRLHKLNLAGHRFPGRKNPTETRWRTVIAQTCRVCGELLDGRFFTKNSTGREEGKWSTKCLPCHSRLRKGIPQTPQLNRASHTLLQQASLPTATRHRQPWLQADDAFLSDPTLTVLQKAIAVGRTYYATNNRCTNLGVKSKRGLGLDLVTGRWVIDNPNNPLLQEEAA